MIIFNRNTLNILRKIIENRKIIMFVFSDISNNNIIFLQNLYFLLLLTLITNPGQSRPGFYIYYSFL